MTTDQGIGGPAQRSRGPLGRAPANLSQPQTAVPSASHSLGTAAIGNPTEKEIPVSHSRFDLELQLDPDVLAITPRLDPADGMRLTLNKGAAMFLTDETARALWGALGAALAPGGPAGPLKTIAVLLNGLRFDNCGDVAKDFERAIADLGMTVPTVRPALEKDEVASC